MRGTAGEERWENTCNRLSPTTRSMGAFLRKNCTVRIRNWDDTGEVWSDRKFLSFLWWFEKRIRLYEGKLRVINATEGGARIAGAEHIGLEEALSALAPLENAAFAACVLQQNTPDAIPLSAGFQEAINGYAKFLNKLGSAAERAALISGRIMRDPREAQNLHHELDKADELAYSDPVFSKLLSSTLQRVIHTVKEGFSLTDDNAKAKKEKSRDEQIKETYAGSKALYEGIAAAVRDTEGFMEKYILGRIQ
jgi:hypothetical protein